MMYLGYDCPICNGQDISVAWFGPTYKWVPSDNKEAPFRIKKVSDEVITSCYCNNCGYKWEEK